MVKSFLKEIFKVKKKKTFVGNIVYISLKIFQPMQLEIWTMLVLQILAKL